MTNEKCSQLFFYLGKETFTKIGKCQFYSQVYKDIETEEKEEKKRIKNMMKDDPNSVLAQVYKTRYPNKKIYFDWMIKKYLNH